MLPFGGMYSSRRTNEKTLRASPKGFEKDPAITYFRAESTIIGPECLTAVFGMGTGVTTRVCSPGFA